LIEKKMNLETSLQASHRPLYDRLLEQGRNLGKLMLLNRNASYEWLNTLPNRWDGEGCGDDQRQEVGPLGVSGCIPTLTSDEQAAIKQNLEQRERFLPWTHRLVETISALPYIQRRFPYQEYVQKVGRLEADGWLVRVYVNHETATD